MENKQDLILIIADVLIVISKFLALFFFLRFIYNSYIEHNLWLKTSNDKLLDVKTKIAYEMHQDIGNDLNALLFKIRNLHLKNGNPSSAAYLQLEEKTTQIIKKVNDIVWSLKSDENSLQAFIEYLNAYTVETLKSTGIEFNLKSKTTRPKLILNHEVKKNIHLFFKEGLNNVIKHAEANLVEISIVQNSNKLSLMIKDNGKGFQLNEIIKGNGIDNMKQRINQLNGKLEFIANNPKGTIVKFEIKV